MDVTMAGTGGMAQANAARVLAGSHSVTLHGRTQEEAEALEPVCEPSTTAHRRFVNGYADRPARRDADLALEAQAQSHPGR